uniref:Uncharacterized protein n=1 Tax=Anguilla anguilla TaxID=7936 RepID=A0A0E9SMS9_ANGAN
MIVGARRGGSGISETAAFLGFCVLWPLEFTETGMINRKRNTLLMREVRGEWADLFRLTERPQMFK